MSLRTNSLFFSYAPKNKDKIYAIRDINIDIPLDKTTAIVGKTGSGKSTLIQTFNALLLPTEGSVEVANFVVTNNRHKNKANKDLRKYIGIVFQFPEYQLFEETVLTDVKFGPKNFGDSDEVATKKAKVALSMLGIDESYYERSPFELSGGERRKVALAGILAIDPDIIIFDEPTAGLDNKSVDELLDIFTNLRKLGKTIIVVTHDMNLVYDFCENVVVLENGQVVYQGSPKSLFSCNSQLFSLNLPNIVKIIYEISKYNSNILNSNIKTLEEAIQFIKEVKK